MKGERFTMTHHSGESNRNPPPVAASLWTLTGYEAHQCHQCPFKKKKHWHFQKKTPVPSQKGNGRLDGQIDSELLKATEIEASSRHQPPKHLKGLSKMVFLPCSYLHHCEKKQIKKAPRLQLPKSWIGFTSVIAKFDLNISWDRRIDMIQHPASWGNVFHVLCIFPVFSSSPRTNTSHSVSKAQRIP